MAEIFKCLQEAIDQEFPNIVYLAIYGSGTQIDFERASKSEKIFIQNDLDVLIVVDNVQQKPIDLVILTSMFKQYFVCTDFDFVVKNEKWLKKKRNTLFQYDLVHQNCVIVGDSAAFQKQLYCPPLNKVSKLDLFDYYVTRSWAMCYMYAQAFRIIDENQERLTIQTRKVITYIADMKAINAGTYALDKQLRLEKIENYVQDSGMGDVLQSFQTIHEFEMQIKTRLLSDDRLITLLLNMNMDMNAAFFSTLGTSRLKLLGCVFQFLIRYFAAIVLGRGSSGRVALQSSMARVLSLWYTARASETNDIEKRFNVFFHKSYFGMKL